MSVKLSDEELYKILFTCNRNPAAAALETEKCARDTLYWLLNYAKTLNEHAEQGSKTGGIETFPEIDYVAEFVYVWEHENRIIIPKSRQMMVSWLCMAMIVHQAQFVKGQRIGVQSKKEDDANDMIMRGKVIYDNQPKFLKKNPINPQNQGKDVYNFLRFPGKDWRTKPDHNSIVEGVAQGSDQTRGKTYSWFFVDEGGFQEKFQESFISLIPTLDDNSKLIIVSSAAPETFFDYLVHDKVV